jgi:hypothetical protein
MIIQRLFSEKKEKNHKKSNAVYATGVGLSMAGAGVLGNTFGKAKGRKLAAEENLRETDTYKEAAKKDKKISEEAKKLVAETKNAQKNILNSKTIKPTDKVKSLIKLESVKRHAKKLSKRNLAEKGVKEVGNSVAKSYLKGKKGTLALSAGTAALGAGLVGKSVKMRKEEDSKSKKD